MSISQMNNLAKNMRITTAEIDAQPEDNDWTMFELEALESLRLEARRLFDMATAILEEINGR